MGYLSEQIRRQSHVRKTGIIAPRKKWNSRLKLETCPFCQCGFRPGELCYIKLDNGSLLFNRYSRLSRASKTLLKHAICYTVFPVTTTLSWNPKLRVPKLQPDYKYSEDIISQQPTTISSHLKLPYSFDWVLQSLYSFRPVECVIFRIVEWL